MDLEYWMTNLSESLTCQPLTLLAIPGSHNSASYAITDTSALSPDSAAYDVLNIMGSVGLKLSLNWTRTQDRNLTQQLFSGIRYFDFRVLSTETSSASSTSGGIFYFVHGQFANEVTIELFNIRTFLKDHPKEIVLLDFNHFYHFNAGSIDKLEKFILKIFGEMLAPRSLHPPSLNQLWAGGHQVIFFFQSDEASLIPALWTREHIEAPWPNTTDLSVLFQFLDKNPPSCPDKFHVSQIVLTPDAKCILSNLDGGLKSMAKLVNAESLSWLEQRNIDLGHKRLNIIIFDFAVSLVPDILKTVISLNSKD